MFGFLRKWIGRRPGFLIELDYPVHPRPRYGYGKPSHPEIVRLLETHRDDFGSALEVIRSYRADLWGIGSTVDPVRPEWINDYLTPFDAMSLYAFIRRNRPQTYVEIGSGHSTRFARRAVEDGKLSTAIVCIDPQARTEVRAIATRVIEQPVEDIPLDLFDSLNAGDILFIDNSHRVFTNSDVTVVFLDILPRLKPGVLVHLHDIFLPADYPPEWNGRYYSEQYLLACHLLAPARNFAIMQANSFISGDRELISILDEVWEHPRLRETPRHGCSFWMRMTEERG